MAFQPIIDVEVDCICAYEALVRGTNNEAAHTILSQVNDANRYAFDQRCRVEAINLAVEIGIVETGAKLSINFMPGAIYSATACIRLTLETARQAKFPLDRLVFEITEAEQVKDSAHLVSIVREYHRHGFLIAMDDFGAGYAGMNLLADVTPDILKLDMALIRDLPHRPTALAIVQSLTELCGRLGIALVAEGVETVEEYAALRAIGISLMQGYLLARPAFEALPPYHLPALVPATPLFKAA